MEQAIAVSGKLDQLGRVGAFRTHKLRVNDWLLIGGKESFCQLVCSFESDISGKAQIGKLVLQVTLLVLRPFAIITSLGRLNFHHFSVSVAEPYRHSPRVLSSHMFDFLDRIMVYLVCLAADEKDFCLPGPDRDVGQLRHLVFQDDSRHALRDFFRAVGSFQENDLAFGTSRARVDVCSLAIVARVEGFRALADHCHGWEL